MRWKDYCEYLLYLSPWKCKGNWKLSFLKQAHHDMCPFLRVLPRSCCGQCSGGHFSTDADSVQREVRSCKKPEAAAPCTAWNLHLILRQGLSLTEGTWYTKLSQGRVQAGSRCRTEDWKPLKHPPHVHDHPSCFDGSSLLCPASNLLLLHRK